MVNKKDSENLVALLKYLPLHPNQFWAKYAHRKVRVYADCQLSAKEIFRTPCCQLGLLNQKQLSNPTGAI